MTGLELRRVIGLTLRELRECAGLTQRELARRMGSHREIVCRLEVGRHVATLASAQRFAVACGFELWDVLAALDEAAASSRASS